MMRQRQTWLVAAAAVVLPGLLSLGACGKKDPQNCNSVAAHVISLVRSELAKDADADRVKEARANLPTLQNALAQACEEQKWDQASRHCITGATSAAETRECAPGLQTPSTESAATTEQSR
jgi:hypothetical protein